MSLAQLLATLAPRGDTAPRPVTTIGSCMLAPKCIYTVHIHNIRCGDHRFPLPFTHSQNAWQFADMFPLFLEKGPSTCQFEPVAIRSEAGLEAGPLSL